MLYAELKRSGSPDMRAALPFYKDTGIAVTPDNVDRIVALETDRYRLKLIEAQEHQSDFPSIDVEAIMRAHVMKFLHRNLLHVEVVYATPENIDEVLEVVQRKADFDSWCVA